MQKCRQKPLFCRYAGGGELRQRFVILKISCNFVKNTTEMKPRVYIDTSIVGGFFDKEFSAATQALFERLKNGEVTFVVSDLLKKELIRAPLHVQDLFQNYEESCFEHVELTEEAKKLANDYIEAKVVGKTSLEDCQHIAIATICKVDVLASWNFRHIVNLDKIKGYNGINLRNGYAIIEIRNPKDLISYGND
jgi:predicted nucleic acid-binding protein